MNRSVWLWCLLTAILAVAGTLGALWLLRPAAPEVVRWSVLPPEGVDYDPDNGPPVLSPDGETIAFVGENGEGTQALWLQPVGSREAEALSGTEDAGGPFWSPDGRSIAFFADDMLRRIDLADGTILDLAPTRSPRGGSWGTDDTILYAPSLTGPLFAVPARGGEPVQVTELDDSRGETSHRHPVFLPDGRSFLFLVQREETPSVGENLALFAGSLDSPERERVVDTRASVHYAFSGHLLYLRDDTLVAHPFDPRTRELSGEPVPLVREMDRTFHFETIVSVSDTGRLLYQPRIQAETSRLTWLDREGQAIGTVGKAADYSTVALSNDERRIATAIYDPLTRNSDIWIVDIERGTSARITFESGDDLAPVWGPDDERIYYYSERAGGTGTFSKRAEASAESRRVTEAKIFHLLWSVSPDGQTGWLMTNHFPRGTRWDVEKLDLETGETEIFLGGAHRESGPSISPDGEWLAYHSDETGERQIHVVPVQDKGGPWQVSTGGGSYAEWTRGGREIVFRAPDGALMAAEIELEPVFSAAPPVRLFHPRERAVVGNRYDVTSDGQRFLVNRPSDPGAVEPWVLVENWTAELE